jgi:hypothetical protein
MIWDNDRIVEQVDLFKIHHFDNMARSTSLKVLEFNMRMDSIEDLPFDVGIELTPQQINTLTEYMWHDIEATKLFYDQTIPQIKFREELSKRYGKNFINHNDTKIGDEIFIMRLENADPGCCYQRVNGRRTLVQTHRENIKVKDIILPYIHFNTNPFKDVLNWFNNAILTGTKGAIKDISCTLNGFKFDFGTGGIHGSVESQIVHSDDEWIIEDWDVASYYPNLSIVNKLYPAHLGETFCTVYKEIYDERRTHAKGTAENAMLKLALNGVYGKSNSQYSPFYDPQYTMAITINGQLSLCMLAETLMSLSGLQMIQINTDGLTIRYPRIHKEWVHDVMRKWEQLTKLTLEVAEYSRMFVRDVNNYLAEYTDGKLKRKGAYEYGHARNGDWHKNHSSPIVAKAAEDTLLNNSDIATTINNHHDVFDFFICAKVPRNFRLEYGQKCIGNIARYYVSTDGDILEKVMPPAGPEGQYKRANGLTNDFYYGVLDEIGEGVWDERIHTKNKSKYQNRSTAINNGFTVKVCNDLTKHEVKDINYDWYIREANKLVTPLVNGSY